MASHRATVSYGQFRLKIDELRSHVQESRTLGAFPASQILNSLFILSKLLIVLQRRRPLSISPSCFVLFVSFVLTFLRLFSSS